MAAANEEQTKAPSRQKSNHPTFLLMAKEAIITLAEKKGSSVAKIQASIAEKYALDVDSVRQHLKPALAKGLENGTFVRPKDSDSKGFTGRFKVDMAKLSSEAKAKEKKEKLKEKAKKTEKKTVKRASSKSPKKVSKKNAPKKVVKKSPKKATGKAAGKPKASAKAKAEIKPKVLKATLKTPKKTPKKPKTAKTPKSSSNKK